MGPFSLPDMPEDQMLIDPLSLPTESDSNKILLGPIDEEVLTPPCVEQAALDLRTLLSYTLEKQSAECSKVVDKEIKVDSLQKDNQDDVTDSHLNKTPIVDPIKPTHITVSSPSKTSPESIPSPSKPSSTLDQLSLLKQHVVELEQQLKTAESQFLADTRSMYEKQNTAQLLDNQMSQLYSQVQQLMRAIQPVQQAFNEKQAIRQTLDEEISQLCQNIANGNKEIVEKKKLLLQKKQDLCQFGIPNLDMKSVLPLAPVSFHLTAPSALLSMPAPIDFKLMQQPDIAPFDTHQLVQPIPFKAATENNKEMENFFAQFPNSLDKPEHDMTMSVSPIPFPTSGKSTPISSPGSYSSPPPFGKKKNKKKKPVKSKSVNSSPLVNSTLNSPEYKETAANVVFKDQASKPGVVGVQDNPSVVLKKEGSPSISTSNDSSASSVVKRDEMTTITAMKDEKTSVAPRSNEIHSTLPKKNDDASTMSKSHEHPSAIPIKVENPGTIPNSNQNSNVTSKSNPIPSTLPKKDETIPKSNENLGVDVKKGEIPGATPKRDENPSTTLKKDDIPTAVSKKDEKVKQEEQIGKPVRDTLQRTRSSSPKNITEMKPMEQTEKSPSPILAPNDLRIEMPSLRSKQLADKKITLVNDTPIVTIVNETNETEPEPKRKLCVSIFNSDAEDVVNDEKLDHELDPNDLRISIHSKLNVEKKQDKVIKPCAYYNSNRCRNEACPFDHVCATCLRYHPNYECRDKPTICTTYNLNGRCRYPKCHHFHVCIMCFGDHPLTSASCSMYRNLKYDSPQQNYRDFCYNFNADGKCTHPYCTRRHKCLNCLGNHGAVECVAFLRHLMDGRLKKAFPSHLMELPSYDYPHVYNKGPLVTPTLTGVSTLKRNVQEPDYSLQDSKRVKSQESESIVRHV